MQGLRSRPLFPNGLIAFSSKLMHLILHPKPRENVSLALYLEVHGQLEVGQQVPYSGL